MMEAYQYLIMNSMWIVGHKDIQMILQCGHKSPITLGQPINTNTRWLQLITPYQLANSTASKRGQKTNSTIPTSVIT